MNTITVMPLADIKRALQTANLGQLSRLTGLDVRVLRRIKNGDQRDIMVSTAELLSTHLQPKVKGKK